MRGMAQDLLNMEIKRKEFMDTGFKLFSEKTIEMVTLPQIAEAAGYGTATLYRYFDKKPGFVVAVATWKWEQFQAENQKRRPRTNFDDMTAVDIFEYYLNSFLLLYKSHRDLLRFNQFFNVYVQSEHIEAETLRPYQAMIDRLREQFHSMYLKAEQDKTLRTDESEEKMFSKTLHLMLAVVTRYAVGLLYIPENGFDAMEELTFQKDMLLKEYKRG